MIIISINNVYCSNDNISFLYYSMTENNIFVIKYVSYDLFLSIYTGN